MYLCVCEEKDFECVTIEMSNHHLLVVRASVAFANLADAAALTHVYKSEDFRVMLERDMTICGFSIASQES